MTQTLALSERPMGWSFVVMLTIAQDQTINRLLRAQTGRSRSKLDGPPLLPDPATASSFDANHTIPDTRRPGPAPKEGMIRWVSSISGDNVNLRVGVPVGKENWLDVGDVGRGGGGLERRDVSGVCAVEGCKESRKYRSLKRFKVGGCCMTHLKAVEAALAGG